MANRFTYEIVEHIATLGKSGSISKELNRVSFSGADAKFDIRAWSRSGDEEKMLKGITLTLEEIAALKAALNALEDIPGGEKPHRKVFGIFKATGDYNAQR